MNLPALPPILLPNLTAAAAILALLFASAPAQPQQPAAPKLSAAPLTAEQLSVYKTVLNGWTEQDTVSLNLAIQTDPQQQEGPFAGHDCGKGLDLEPIVEGLVHRFAPTDVAQLGSAPIHLVDPEAGRQDVKENDPGRSIAKGRSIDDAVRNGFAHGLFTLGEIRFDKSHTHAIVSYGFFCGSLCGNGGTVILVKTADGWRESSRCGSWIS